MPDTEPGWHPFGNVRSMDDGKRWWRRLDGVPSWWEQPVVEVVGGRTHPWSFSAACGTVFFFLGIAVRGFHVWAAALVLGAVGALLLAIALRTIFRRQDRRGSSDG
jgi:hypothetical protein